MYLMSLSVPVCRDAEPPLAFVALVDEFDAYYEGSSSLSQLSATSGEGFGYPPYTAGTSFPLSSKPICGSGSGTSSLPAALQVR
jgi:hypothetical protein